MAASPRSVYELNVSLNGIDPPIWRQVQLWEDTTLPELHRILQILFGWNGVHAHEFALAGQVYGSPNTAHPNRTILDEKAIPLNRLLTTIGDELTYTYDFGDNWRHHLTLAASYAPEDDAFYPRCVAGERPAPPDDAGGPYAYVAFLKTLEPGNLPIFSIDLINNSLRQEFAGPIRRRLPR
jgi:hypothetical protein